MEDGRMMEEKREADEEIAAESTGRALRGRTRRDGVAAKRRGQAPEDRTRRDGVAVERRGWALKDRTRRDGIADEMDRADARGKNTHRDSETNKKLVDVIVGGYRIRRDTHRGILLQIVFLPVP